MVVDLGVAVSGGRGRVCESAPTFRFSDVQVISVPVIFAVDFDQNLFVFKLKKQEIYVVVVVYFGINFIDDCEAFRQRKLTL